MSSIVSVFDAEMLKEREVKVNIYRDESQSNLFRYIQAHYSAMPTIIRVSHAQMAIHISYFLLLKLS